VDVPALSLLPPRPVVQKRSPCSLFPWVSEASRPHALFSRCPTLQRKAMDAAGLPYLNGKEDHRDYFLSGKPCDLRRFSPKARGGLKFPSNNFPFSRWREVSPASSPFFFRTGREAEVRRSLPFYSTDCGNIPIFQLEVTVSGAPLFRVSR